MMVSSQGDIDSVACTRVPRGNDNDFATTPRCGKGRQFAYRAALSDLHLFQPTTQASKQNEGYCGGWDSGLSRR